MSKQPRLGWAVIRRLVGSGGTPEEDECHFDGCYFDVESDPKDDTGKAMALSTYVGWCADYPEQHVVLVRIEQQKIPGAPFADKEAREAFAGVKNVWVPM